MKTTIIDVAGLAGVSETTVSLAFRPKSRISDETRQRVLKAALKLNYMPNDAARNLRSGGYNIIGILINDIMNPFYAQMIRMVQMTAQAEEYQIMIFESQWDSKKELAAINRMLQARIQGVVICQCEKNSESLKLLDRYEVPYVAMDTFPLDYTGPYVANDLSIAGELAAAHLIAAECKNPVLVIPKSGSEYFSAFARLINGFSKVMESRGVPFGSYCIFNTGLKIEDGLHIFDTILEKLPKVDGILCGNDLCALGVIEAIDQKGLKVGQDIAVMGIDDLEISKLSRVSLTSIQQPYAEISELATKAIIQSIQTSTPVSIRKTMAPKLMSRNSTCRNQRIN